jgi:hypothetical protein
MRELRRRQFGRGLDPTLKGRLGATLRTRCQSGRIPITSNSIREPRFCEVLISSFSRGFRNRGTRAAAHLSDCINTGWRLSRDSGKLRLASSIVRKVSASRTGARLAIALVNRIDDGPDVALPCVDNNNVAPRLFPVDFVAAGSGFCEVARR